MVAPYAGTKPIPAKRVSTAIFIPVTNAIERRFREVRRRTRPMGVFSDRTSMDRIFNHENQNQSVSTLCC
jgi:transposase-like protein